MVSIVVDGNGDGKVEPISVEKITRGTGAIAAATSVVITHGLGATPKIYDVSITAQSDTGSGIRFWVSAVSATTFTLTTSASASFSFGWQATVYQ